MVDLQVATYAKGQDQTFLNLEATSFWMGISWIVTLHSKVLGGVQSASWLMNHTLTLLCELLDQKRAGVALCDASCYNQDLSYVCLLPH
jgi:hypothetical protein